MPTSHLPPKILCVSQCGMFWCICAVPSAPMNIFILWLNGCVPPSSVWYVNPQFTPGWISQISAVVLLMSFLRVPPISQMSWPRASIRTKSACSAPLSADVIEGERFYRTRNLPATGWALLIPHAAPSCCFLSDPWALVNTQGSRPHPKPGAIKMNNDRLSLFSLLQTSQPKWGSREVLRTSSEPET